MLVAHLDGVLAVIEEDAEALDCKGEIQAAREIASAGTSADHQIACFDRVSVTSAGKRGALSAVVDWIAQTTAGAVG